MLNTFYALLGRMKYIDRWCLMRSSRPENLCEPALETAYIAHALVLLNRQRGGQLEPEKSVLYALYHDCTEILTGDMPTPVKYYSSEMRSVFGMVEKEACQRLLNMLPDDLSEEFSPLFFKEERDAELWRLIKAADKLSAYIKCIEERKAGICEFEDAERTIRKALDESECREAHIFLEEFIPAYELPLDKLK